MFAKQIVDEFVVCRHWGTFDSSAVWEELGEGATRDDSKRDVKRERSVNDGFGGLIWMHAHEEGWIECLKACADRGVGGPELRADVGEGSYVCF